MNDCLSIVVHGESGVGKSWFADSTPAPRLVLDAEGGSRFTNSRKITWDGVSAPPTADGSWDTCVVTVRDFNQIKRVFQWLNAGQHDFVSVSLDSLSEIQKRCFTPDTEVLTRRGWQRLDNLDVDALIAQWDINSGAIDFVEPSDRQTLMFDGELVSMPSVSSALLVTPEHRQPTRTQAGTVETRSASDVRRGLQLPMSGMYQGQGPSPSVAEARLLTAYQADGTDPGGRTLRFAFTKHRKIDRLNVLLDDVGAAHKTNVWGGITYIHVERASVPFFNEFMPRKRWEWSTLDWTVDARAAVISELRHWDGSYTIPTSRVSYSTTDELNKDVISALGAVTGHASAVRNNDTVTLVPRTWRRLDRVERVAYTGEVRCLTVPSGFLLTRREGKVTISGNCLDSIAGTDQLTQQDWGALLRQMESLVRQFRDLTLHPTKPVQAVVLICVTSTKDGKAKPHVQGQLAVTLPYFVDCVGYMYVQMDETGVPVRRMLMQPTGAFVAKDRTNRLGTVIENPRVDQMLDTVFGTTNAQGAQYINTNVASSTPAVIAAQQMDAATIAAYQAYVAQQFDNNEGTSNTQ